MISCREDQLPDKTCEAGFIASTGDEPCQEEPYEDISCPTGFIAVRGNETLGTSDFCVMQFEARDAGGNVASASSAGAPELTIRSSDAQTSCEAMTDDDFLGTFTLISNPEWMTIARDIELVASNWSGGSVGSGQIPRGHSDGTPNSVQEAGDGSDPYFGTGQSSSDSPGSGWEQKRTLNLKNGFVIWDFAGNAYDWVDWDATSVGYTNGPTDGGSAVWREIDDLVGSVGADDVSSINGYTSVQSFGKFYSAISSGGTVRGGDFDDTVNAGAFSLNLTIDPAAQYTNIGYRCVYRPD